MCYNVKILLPCKFVSFLKKTGRAVFFPFIIILNKVLQNIRINCRRHQEIKGKSNYVDALYLKEMKDGKFKAR